MTIISVFREIRTFSWYAQVNVSIERDICLEGRTFSGQVIFSHQTTVYVVTS